MSDLLPLCYLDVSDPALLRASFMRLPSILCGDSALGALFFCSCRFLLCAGYFDFVPVACLLLGDVA